MSDIDERVGRLEQDRDHARDAWLYKAAEERAWHDPRDALALVSKDDIATAAAAERAVAAYDEVRPFLRRRELTQEEIDREHGRWLLAQLDGSR
jgi:chemotaxis regulatin CheY-phosphate phosphatase CheZ